MDEMQEAMVTPLVLIVDDHAPAAEMIKRLFEMRGYRADTANNGEGAINKAIDLQPDLILLDVMMPGMDGFEVMKALRSHTITTDIPTIFITAKDEAEDIERGLALGADDYIPKPIKPRELMARAQNKLEAYRLRKQLQQRTADLRAMLQMSETLNNRYSVDELLEYVIYLALDIVPSHSAIVYQFDEFGEIMHVTCGNRHGESFNVEIDDDQLMYHMDSSDALVTWQDPDAGITSADYGMAIKLRHGDAILGILAVFHDQPFASYHQQMFEGASRQITLALRNAIFYEEQLRYAERLQDLVDERTAELRSAQNLLIRSEKLASVGQLAAGIAHEINNPLLPIRLNLELMQEDVEAGNPIHPEDIEQSLNSVRRISRTIERLQQFTRKRAEDIPNIEEFNLAEVINDVLGLSRTYIRKSGLDVAIDIHEDIIIHGSRDQLEQVFLNLIINAQAAMNDGGRLSITSEVIDDQIILCFADTGHGIGEDLINKIFDSFVTTKASGTGLGLFISHHIIETHNGTIEVESEVGKGTVFTITLPINEGLKSGAD